MEKSRSFKETQTRPRLGINAMCGPGVAYFANITTPFTSEPTVTGGRSLIGCPGAHSHSFRSNALGIRGFICAFLLNQSPAVIPWIVLRRVLSLMNRTSTATGLLPFAAEEIVTSRDSLPLARPVVLRTTPLGILQLTSANDTSIANHENRTH